MIGLSSRALFEIDLTVAGPQNLGVTPAGERRVFLVTGGRFEGERLRGKVLDGGADWVLIRPDAVLQLDVRTTLETDDGALIGMTYRGLRHGPPEVMEQLARGETVDPSAYYFRIAAFFETGAQDYLWLNRICAIGLGDRRPTGPHYSLIEIL